MHHSNQYIFIIANTFHGIPDKQKFCELVHSRLNPMGKFCILNWHKLPREDTKVLDKPRGPKDEMRMSPDDLKTIVCENEFQEISIIQGKNSL